ncbi:hypothetical protein [Domibacillus robiginosus]|uniref:hypothetical protein n=1 Tax=Domibacillus robiginosus TaxID=1071054 RepID=UPI0009E4A3F4|nr:hypothetical protein [Domibacillus robiginosus]
MKTGMRFDQYLSVLLEKRKHEPRTESKIIEKKVSFSSPSGSVPTEEIRLFTEYKEQANLLQIAKSAPEKKKFLMLKKFLKMRRNQQVIVFLKKNDQVVEITGKVNAVGRDFVMLTSIKERIWIPFQAIESANIPTGIPLYSTTHQNVIYDNQLKQRLLSNFGETVAARDVLIQQFYEETLLTNLNSWKSFWVKVETEKKTLLGKIEDTDGQILRLSFGKEKYEINAAHIVSIRSIRYISLFPLIVSRLFQRITR